MKWPTKCRGPCLEYQPEHGGSQLYHKDSTHMRRYSQEGHTGAPASSSDRVVETESGAQVDQLETVLCAEAHAGRRAQKGSASSREEESNSAAQNDHAEMDDANCVTFQGIKQRDSETGTSAAVAAEPCQAADQQRLGENRGEETNQNLTNAQQSPAMLSHSGSHDTSLSSTVRTPPRDPRGRLHFEICIMSLWVNIGSG